MLQPKDDAIDYEISIISFNIMRIFSAVKFYSSLHLTIPLAKVTLQLSECVIPSSIHQCNV